MPKSTSASKNSRVAEFIARRVYQLRGRRSQLEIAKIAGFESTNMISMLKAGTSKVPLARVTDLARALECDPGHLMRLALEQHLPPEVVTEITISLGGLISSNEVKLLARIRELSRQGDPALTPRVDGFLEQAFATR
jgi:DNA-binding Xre family transcriptional regulator